MRRLYDTLHQAVSRRHEVDREHDEANEAEHEFAEDLSSLAAALKRLELKLPEVRQEIVEEFAGLEVSIDAIEDRLDAEPGPADPEARATARALDERLARLEQEFPGLRAEISETIDKRVQSTVSRLVELERQRTTRDRFEVRLDALRRDLDRNQQRHTILAGAVLLCGFLVYAC